MCVPAVGHISLLTCFYCTLLQVLSHCLIYSLSHSISGSHPCPFSFSVPSSLTLSPPFASASIFVITFILWIVPLFLYLYCISPYISPLLFPCSPSLHRSSLPPSPPPSWYLICCQWLQKQASELRGVKHFDNHCRGIVMCCLFVWHTWQHVTKLPSCAHLDCSFQSSVPWESEKENQQIEWEKSVMAGICKRFAYLYFEKSLLGVQIWKNWQLLFLPTLPIKSFHCLSCLQYYCGLSLM